MRPLGLNVETSEQLMATSLLGLQPSQSAKLVTSFDDRAICVHRGMPVDVAPRTGPLDVLEGRNVLVIADAQNLDLGARDLGFKVSWGGLGRGLDVVADSIARHVVLAEPPGGGRRSQYFAARGWQPHCKHPHMVRTRHGMVPSSNADHTFAFAAGRLVITSTATVIVLCSGDGELVEDVAQAIQTLPSDRKLVTLSLAGSTAGRLNCSSSPHISANIELGLDCLRPHGRPRRRRKSRILSFGHPGDHKCIGQAGS
jgi:hypothetical protein